MEWRLARIRATRCRSSTHDQNRPNQRDKLHPPATEAYISLLCERRRRGHTGAKLKVVEPLPERGRWDHGSFRARTRSAEGLGRFEAIYSRRKSAFWPAELDLGGALPACPNTQIDSAPNPRRHREIGGAISR